MVDIVHKNILKKSQPQTVVFCAEISERFLDLCELHGRVKGTALDIPKDLDADMLLWRQMVKRFKKRDYRNSREERDALKRVADFMMETNCKLRNVPYVPFQWTDA